MTSSEQPLKKVKVEHEPDGPFGCPFCFESCRGKGRGVDALVCKGFETTWHKRVEVFEMPKVPKGQVVIKVEGEEGEGGGGGCGEGECLLRSRRAPTLIFQSQ